MARSPSDIASLNRGSTKDIIGYDCVVYIPAFEHPWLLQTRHKRRASAAMTAWYISPPLNTTTFTTMERALTGDFDQCLVTETV